MENWSYTGTLFYNNNGTIYVIFAATRNVTNYK